MKKNGMKKLLWTVGGVLAVVIAIGLIAPLFISEEVVKQQVVQQFEKNTGHKIIIAGKLTTRIFPFAGVNMQDVTIEGFPGGEPLMRLKSMNVDVALLPLLSKNIIIQELAFENPQINLRVNQAGRPNWEIKSAAVKEEKAPAAEGTSPSLPQNFILADLRITDGAVNYRNAQSGDQWTLGELNMDASLDSLSDPLKVDGSAKWNDRAVKADVTVDTLRDLLAGNPAGLDANVKSDLLSAKLDGKIEKQVFAGTLSADSPSLKEFIAWINPQSKLSAQAPMALNIKGNTQCTQTYCNFTDAVIALDDVEARGSVKAQWSGQVPRVEVNLAADELNLNPFLPAAEESQASAVPLVSDAQAAEGWSSEPINFSALNSVNALVNVEAGKILARDLIIGKTVLRAKLERGALSADVADAVFYGGRASIAVNMAAAGQGANVEQRWLLKSIQAEPFLKDLTGSDRLRGTGDLQLVANTRGGSQRELIGNLTGNGQLKILDGAIKGFNLANMVRNVQAAYKDVNTGAQSTDFAELSGTFNIVNGVVKNDDLAMKAPLIRLSGKGQISLPQKTINYRLEPEIVSTMQGQGGKEKQGITVPVLVAGTLENPTFAPDVRAVAQDVIQNPEAYKEKVGEVKQSIKDIKGLFKKPKAEPAAQQAAPTQPAAQPDAASTQQAAPAASEPTPPAEQAPAAGTAQPPQQ